MATTYNNDTLHRFFRSNQYFRPPPDIKISGGSKAPSSYISRVDAGHYIFSVTKAVCVTVN